MRYVDLKQKLNKLRVFSTQDILLWDENFRLGNLDRWEKEEKIIQLKRGWYIFGDAILTEKDLWLISNRIYQPSYVSLESALSYYGVIPEGVRQVSGITTNKTATFENNIGVFNYASIKTDLNFGYGIIEYENQGIKLAHIEKALLDLFYLRSDIQDVEDLEMLRLNKDIINEKLSEQRFRQYLEIFSSPRIERLVKLLDQYLDA
jgi:predicted transcriptional regulator of viral defense system